MLIKMGMFFMGARRKATMRKFAAYVLVEPIEAFTIWGCIGR
jgi:hypothetical protein